MKYDSLACGALACKRTVRTDDRVTMYTPARPSDEGHNDALAEGPQSNPNRTAELTRKL
jgi:hypothetical protein